MRFCTLLMLATAVMTQCNLADAQQPEGIADANSLVRQGPRPLKGASHGVGRLLPDATLTDLSGKAHKLSELAKEHQGLVIAMTSTSCPLSKKYLPTLVDLAKASGDEVGWLIVNPIANDSVEAMHTAAQSFRDGGSQDQVVVYGHDRESEFASRIGALTTTDVIVVDRFRTVIYHGAIDDQYGFGYALDQPRHRYLADALAALKADKVPEISATEAPGCTLESNSGVTTKLAVTYHNRVSRIVQQHCLDCHREDGVAPFSLASYDDLDAHAGMIQEVVQRGIMPPWFAADSTQNNADTVTLSPWINDCSLAAAEKRDLLNWIAGGRPLGDPSDAPQPRQFVSTWQIGNPDAIFQFAKPEPVKATGVMPYKNVDVQTDLDEDKWVQAIEVRPGDPSVVHHVLVFAQGADDAANERDGYWGIYVPGNSTLVYPDGFAKRLPKGAKLRFQMHYTPNGTATTDKTSIGLRFAKELPLHEVKVKGIYNDKIKIPAGAENHPEVAKLTIPAEARVLGFLPHMHLRGKACRFELTRGDGEAVTLLDVPRYDFNWQLLYRYREPLELEPGDTLRFTCWYDNSDKNPANPDPSKTVRWGPQTYDEMQVGYVEYYLPGVKPDPSLGNGGQSSAGDSRKRRNAILFQRLDVNRDGVITKAEVRERMPDEPKAAGPIFDRLDTNQDGKLDPSELEKL